MSELPRDWLKIAFKEKFVKFFEYNSFDDLKIIGNGGFSTVYGAYSKDIEKVIALKKLDRSLPNDSGNSFDNFKSEVKNIIEITHHDNIVRFYGITQDLDPESETYYMVLEYANNGDLRCYLHEHFSELDWLKKIRMAREISMIILIVLPLKTLIQ
ncbi:35646_t:CDS:2 [Gigaspora margarita]|uniref:non-specific serine/threonine protein kinase n=1 Tax=Gigaspora margarita TaxID=4874 RepID=A0ABN7VJH5_GIGMA|nr:35646_t:CDS:2 [Gigaspora margarita]